MIRSLGELESIVRTNLEQKHGANLLRYNILSANNVAGVWVVDVEAIVCISRNIFDVCIDSQKRKYRMKFDEEGNLLGFEELSSS